MSTTLWDEYIKTRTNEARNAIVEQYLSFVAFLVNRNIKELPPGLQKEDLLQFGVCGLIEAVEKFDPNQGAKFETYATWRINGAMVDQIRYFGKTGGGLSRSSMRKLKWVEETTKKLEGELKRHPSSQEIADGLGVTFPEYSKILAELSQGVQFSLDELVGFNEPVSVEQFIKNERSVIPEEEYLLSERHELLGKAIDELPENEKKVVVCYYYNEMTLAEIAEYLERSEGRISQLHTQAMIRLRNKLSGGE